MEKLVEHVDGRGDRVIIKEEAIAAAGGAAACDPKKIDKLHLTTIPGTVPDSKPVAPAH